MPKTRDEHKRSLQNPALCELLPVRDALDNVIVRTDGCYVAGFGSPARLPISPMMKVAMKPRSSWKPCCAPYPNKYAPPVSLRGR